MVDWLISVACIYLELTSEAVCSNPIQISICSSLRAFHGIILTLLLKGTLNSNLDYIFIILQFQSIITTCYFHDLLVFVSENWVEYKMTLLYDITKILCKLFLLKNVNTNDDTITCINKIYVLSGFYKKRYCNMCVSYLN